MAQECQEKQGQYEDGQCNCQEGFAFDTYRDRCIENKTAQQYATNTQPDTSGGGVDIAQLLSIVVPLTTALGNVAGPEAAGGGGGCGG